MQGPAADIQRLDRYDQGMSVYTLAVVTDEDQASQVELEDGQVAWQSTIRYDRLHRRVDDATGTVNFEIEELPVDTGGERRLVSLIAEGGRGAELSELVQFGERLLVFDDRTGRVTCSRKTRFSAPTSAKVSKSCSVDRAGGPTLEPTSGLVVLDAGGSLPSPLFAC